MRKILTWCLWSLVVLVLSTTPNLPSQKTKLFLVTDVSAAVTPTRFKGECPQTFLFAGKITVNGKGVVKFRWDRSDGVKGEVQTIEFPGASTEIVTTTWTLGDTGKVYADYWQVLQIIAPLPIASNEAVFSLDCSEKLHTVSYKDIDVSDIYLDQNCRLWIKHINRGTEPLKVMVRENVWINDQLIEESYETIMLEPGAEIRHKIGAEPGFMIINNAKVKVQIDVNDTLSELNEKNNTLETTLFCNRESMIGDATESP